MIMMMMNQSWIMGSHTSFGSNPIFQGFPQKIGIKIWKWENFLATVFEKYVIGNIISL